MPVELKVIPGSGMTTGMESGLKLARDFQAILLIKAHETIVSKLIDIIIGRSEDCGPCRNSPCGGRMSCRPVSSGT